MQDLQPFKDLSVLIVEDDFIVAFDLQTMLPDVLIDQLLRMVR